MSIEKNIDCCRILENRNKFSLIYPVGFILIGIGCIIGANIEHSKYTSGKLCYQIDVNRMKDVVKQIENNVFKDITKNINISSDYVLFKKIIEYNDLCTFGISLLFMGIIFLFAVIILGN